VRERVVTLDTEAKRRFAAGDVAGAVDRLREACDLVRGLIGTGRPDRDVGLQLGAMLYAVGEWERQRGRFTEAVTALDEAESVYAELGPDAAQMLTDVVIRRARVHAHGNRPLSAVADAQRAVMDSLDRLDDVPRSPRRLDAARIVAHAAQVQHAVLGDPDLVVAAADWAIREVLSGFGPGDPLALTPAEAQTLHIAAPLAALLHTAAGRTGPAEAATWFATATGHDGFTVTDEAVADVLASQPSLATVLTDNDQQRYAGVLTAPPTEVRLLVPAQRVNHSVGAGYGAVLSELQFQTAMGTDPSHERLCGLEPHALFAWASHRGDINMRHQFAHFGVQWLSVLLNFGQRRGEQGEWTAAVDAANWLTGVVGQLLPHAMIDRKVRDNVTAALDWQRSVYAAVGDTAAVRGVEEAAAVVASFDHGPPGR